MEYAVFILEKCILRNYVYIHKDPRTNKVRYVGKGSGKRAWDLKKRYSWHKNWILNLKSLNLKPIVQIIKLFNTAREAFVYEKALIKSYRDSKEPICNTTSGGEGHKPKIEIKPSFETIKIKEKKTRRKHTPKESLEKSLRQMKPIIRIEDGKVYKSVIEAALDINGDTGTIAKVLKGKRKSHKGYTYKYKENN